MKKIDLIFRYHACKIAFALIYLIGVTFTSCSDEDIDTTDSNKGVAVSFNVSNAQSQANTFMIIFLRSVSAVLLRLM